MSINNIILFSSKFSEASKHCEEIIHHNRLHIPIIRLDTKKTRDRALNGKFFQIPVVPTLLVTYQDGNTQLFVGYQKIVMWVQNLTERNSQQHQKPKEEEIPFPEENEFINYEIEEPPCKDVSSKLKMTNAESYQKLKKKKKKKKKPPVRFEEDNDIDYFEEIEPQPISLPKPKSKKKNSLKNQNQNVASKRMSDITSMAKQMEKQRLESLGYDDKKLSGGY